MTRKPSPIRRSTRCEPINPQPPVSKTVFINSVSQWNRSDRLGRHAATMLWIVLATVGRLEVLYNRRVEASAGVDDIAGLRHSSPSPLACPGPRSWLARPDHQHRLSCVPETALSAAS